MLELACLAFLVAVASVALRVRRGNLTSRAEDTPMIPPVASIGGSGRAAGWPVEPRHPWPRTGNRGTR